MKTFFLIPQRQTLVAGILSLSLFGFTGLAASAADNDHAAVGLPEVDILEGFSTLVEAVKPAVVNISVTGTVTTSRRGPNFRGQPPELEEFFRRFFGDQFDTPNRNAPYERKTTAVGSGFIVDPSGLVVTNNHVIEDADEIEVVFDNGTRVPAKLKGTDSKTDLALLEIDGDQPYPYVIFGDSEKTRVGDWVVAIGNPFGLGGTTTKGIISARGRDIRSGLVDDFIQIDAPINRGNSGGPLFNMKGEVIGINSVIYSPNGGSVGIGFAIPSSIASVVINQLKSTGSVQRGYLGIQIQTVDEEIASSLGLDEARGALVTQIVEGSPADMADIEVGDIILSFDGKDILQMRELPKTVALTDIGKQVEVVIWRNQQQKTVRMAVGGDSHAKNTATSSEAQDSSETNTLGLSLGLLNPDTREQYDIQQDRMGVVVTEVEPGSPAAARGMRAGQLITKVGNEPVTSPDEVNAGIRKAIEEGKSSVLLLVQQDGGAIFVALPLDGS